MDHVFKVIDFILAYPGEIAFCIGFPVVLQIVMGGDGGGGGGWFDGGCDGGGGGD
jgi:hypothetical protein